MRHARYVLLFTVLLGIGAYAGAAAMMTRNAALPDGLSQLVVHEQREQHFTVAMIAPARPRVGESMQVVLSLISNSAPVQVWERLPPESAWWIALLDENGDTVAPTLGGEQRLGFSGVLHGPTVTVSPQNARFGVIDLHQLYELEAGTYTLNGRFWPKTGGLQRKSVEFSFSVRIWPAEADE